MDKQEEVWAHVCIDGVVAVVYGLKLAKLAVAELVSSLQHIKTAQNFRPRTQAPAHRHMSVGAPCRDHS